MKRFLAIFLFLLLLSVASNCCYAEEYQEINIQQAEETELLAEAPAPTAEHYKKGSSITDYYPYSEDFVKEYNNVIKWDFNGQFLIEDTAPSFKIFLKKGYYKYCNSNYLKSEILKNYSKDEQAMSNIVALFDLLVKKLDEDQLKEIMSDLDSYKFPKINDNFDTLLLNTQILVENKYGMSDEIIKAIYPKIYHYQLLKPHKPEYFINLNKIIQQMENTGLYEKEDIYKWVFEFSKEEDLSEILTSQKFQKILEGGYLKYIYRYNVGNNLYWCNDEDFINGVIKIVDTMKKYKINDSAVIEIVIDNIYGCSAKYNTNTKTDAACDILTYLYESGDMDIDNFFDEYNLEHFVLDTYIEIKNNPKITNKGEVFVRKVKSQIKRDNVKERTKETMMYTGAGALGVVGAPVIIPFLIHLDSQIGK